MTSKLRPNQRPRFPLTVILITGFLSMGLAAVISQVISSRNSPPLIDVSDKTHEEVIRRLELLEQRYAEDDYEPPSTSDEEGESVSDTAKSKQDDLDISQRVARLEKMEQVRQEAERRRAEQAELIQAQRRRAMAQRAEAGARVMSDTTASDETKAGAWRNMRMNAVEVWNDEIVTEAVRIGTTSSDPQIRADIWRQAHANHTHPLLLQPLLQALANDPHRSVREEAAETLDLYLDQGGVREALQVAAEYDADSGVRQQAQVSLKGPQGGF